MLFAFGPKDLQQYAIPIGIGLAILLILVIPSLRRAIFGNYKEGKEAGEGSTGKKKHEENGDTEKGEK